MNKKAEELINKEEEEEKQLSQPTAAPVAPAATSEWNPSEETMDEFFERKE
jgi:hypothetical protein